ncbi:hypothetical protein [Mangrovicoccus ximenensis]|uniref:hypothetical protein n=1 Tax=Mangrovicoccus ximenensis TaxID=1911570 RepID=UPI000D38EAAD|nr:hypothetical protein [Mangrovicoccus ximenensis]
MPDLRISGALAICPDGAQPLDVTVTGGTIDGLHAPGTGPEAARTIDAGGLWLMPGAIDAHTHFTACGPDRGAEVFESHFCMLRHTWHESGERWSW